MATDEIAWDSLLNRHDSADAFVVVVDSHFVLRAASPEIGAELQINPSDVVGQSAAELIHPDDLLRALDVFQGSMASTAPRSANIYRVRTNAAGVYETFGVTSETVHGGEAIVLRLYKPTEQERSKLLTLEQIDIFEMMGSGRSIEDCLLALVVMVERNGDGTRAIIHVADDSDVLRPITSGSLPPRLLERYQNVSADEPGGVLKRALDTGVTHVGPSSSPEFPRTSSTAAKRPDGSVAGYLELLHPRTAGTTATDFAAQLLMCRLIGLIVDRYVVESRPTEGPMLDALTGLPNRSALEQSANELNKGTHSYGLLALGLDDFTAINSTGHELGDRALSSIGQALLVAIPAGATAFRSGGDQFVVVVPDERRGEPLAALGQAIIEAVDAIRIDDGSKTPKLRVSIGAATSGLVAQEGGFDEVLGQADTAMRVAKRDGGHHVRLHDQPLDSRWVHRKALAESLPAAIKANELFLEFQPIISLNSHYVIGFEALSRWKHPRFGTLRPDDFLPIAEETSLIHAVDTWVLDSAARHVATWNAKTRQPLQVWVNLSARSLARQDLVDQILGLQRQHGVEIGVELTERDSFASSLHADRACEQLSAAGIKLALDDFGAGRSSLFRAVFHGPSVLKIDRSFVNGMLGSDRMMATVSTILDLGRQLGLDVIAEGVESEAQMRKLEMMGCELAQGYLFAPPLTAAVIERRLGPDFDDLRVVKLSTPDEAGHNLNV